MRGSSQQFRCSAGHAESVVPHICPILADVGFGKVVSEVLSRRADEQCKRKQPERKPRMAYLPPHCF
jgi:hypothetical protein